MQYIYNSKNIYSNRTEEVIDATPYIDDRNRSLWETMDKQFNITIEYSKWNSYANYHKGKDSIIYVLKDESPDVVSFTHELLHLYLSSKKIHIGGAIQGTFRELRPLNQIFDIRLYDHLSNALEHIKMFPIFVQMGCPSEEFTQDYDENKLTDEEVNRIQRLYKVGLFKKKYNSKAVNYFIGKFFAAKCDVNPNYNYDNQLLKLRGLDTQLYVVLDKFLNGWIEYDVEKHREVWDDDYNQLIADFTNEMIAWGKDKKFKRHWL